MPCLSRQPIQVFTLKRLPVESERSLGVQTSIAAFLGRAPRGPENKAITITSFGDFERIFGGLDVDYPMGYAVRDFYVNGGTRAIIVRLFRNPAQAAAQAVAEKSRTARSRLRMRSLRTRARRRMTYKNEPEKTAASDVVTAADEAAKLPDATVEQVEPPLRRK